MRFLKLALSVIVMLGLLASCGSMDSPEKAAEEWIEALANLDGIAVAKRTCSEQQSNLQNQAIWASAFAVLGEMLTGQEIEADVSDLHFETIERKGDNARVRVSGQILTAVLLNVQTQEVDEIWFMVREDNTWKWCGSMTQVQVVEATAIAEAIKVSPNEIPIGINVSLTGDSADAGKVTLDAAELAAAEVNETGGLNLSDGDYLVKLIVEDNESTAQGVTAAAIKLTTQYGVLIMIGPQFRHATLAGQVANDNTTPMISPSSNDPRTTNDRPWVFSANIPKEFDAAIMALFAKEELGAQKVAVLYNEDSTQFEAHAESFRLAAEDLGMEVVAFEAYSSWDSMEGDISAQLTTIKAAEPDALFLPGWPPDLALVVKQAHELGLGTHILSMRVWGGFEPIDICGTDCTGLFFNDNSAATTSALTYDAMRIAFKAIWDCGTLTGDLVQDRKCVRDALAEVERFEGVTGTMSFTEDGDPLKCAIIVRISESGEFEFYKQICPEGLK